MNKRLLQKIIKEFFTTFEKQHGFIFYKPTIILRLRNNTLHIINFDLIGGGLNCNIAIQPLYIPSDIINLSFGNRLNHFKIKLPGIWGYSNDNKDIENDFSQIKELLEKNALSWFDEVGSPEGIISFIESGLAEDINIIVGFPPILRNMYLGFSYLYTNKISLAKKPLQEVVEQCKDDKRTWVVQQNNMINNIFALAKNEPNKISEQFNEIIRTTKNNLKIKV